MSLRVLYLGESWLGSCARAMREALQRRSDLIVDEIAEDHYFPKASSLSARIAGRLTSRLHRGDFEREVLRRVDQFRPDLVVAYKGWCVGESLLKQIAARRVRTMNIYPDCSPHAHGPAHRKAVGSYDLVVSSKPYHPAFWSTTYGYSNECVFVGQGYDPGLHLAGDPASEWVYDVVMIATWRREYETFMREFARLMEGKGVTVAIGGYGWPARAGVLPRGWVLPGEVQGRSYVEWLRKGRICIALMSRDMIVDGTRQPGDVDTTRTYELAAAACFFVHLRTVHVQGLYDERTEVPMFESPSELAELVARFRDADNDRMRFAANAHARAVPHYSLDARARSIAGHMQKLTSS